jgi:hypothetical protein
MPYLPLLFSNNNTKGYFFLITLGCVILHVTQFFPFEDGICHSYLNGQIPVRDEHKYIPNRSLARGGYEILLNGQVILDERSKGGISMTPVSMDGDGTLLDNKPLDPLMKKEGVDGVNNNESWFC